MKEKYENQLFYHMLTTLLCGIFGFCMIAISLPERKMDWYISNGYAFMNGLGFLMIVAGAIKLVKMIRLVKKIRNLTSHSKNCQS